MTSNRNTYLTCGLVLAMALVAGAPARAETTTRQIGQYGITWTFADEATFGQFANGDYWVVGPVRIVSIKPASKRQNDRVKHGSMINPKLGHSQGYDSAMYGRYGGKSAYKDDLNVALGVSPQQPLTVEPGSSLISTISHDKAGKRPQLQTAAVLTVLDKPAPEGGFRPPYFGDDKTVQYTVGDLDLSKLPNLEPVRGAPNPATLARRIERPWLEHKLSWTGRYLHPSKNMPDYGRDIALLLGDVSLALLLDYPEEQKRELLIRYVQIGLDLYAIAEAGGTWTDLGGHMHGRKLPIMLSGLVLGNEEMVGIGRTMPNRFQEDRQTFVVTEGDVGRKLYHADKRPREPYTPEHVGLAEWGEQHTRQPERDGSNWNAPYRTIVGHSILAHVLTARLLGLKDEWNHDPLFDYIDRYWAKEKDREQGAARIRSFHKRMWRAYRDTEHATPAP